ncbi:MAG: hypothetical protein HY748_16715 [Elusimicrobia bacterium]|nr:hypothetical protein [Elusimicrobiota bacterium]
MKCSFVLAVPLTLFSVVPLDAAVLTKTRAHGAPGSTLIVPRLRFGELGAGLARGAVLAAPSPGVSVPGIAAPSVLPLAEPLALPSAAPDQAVPDKADGSTVEKLSRISEDIQPDLQALAEPSLKDEGSQTAGERIMAAVLGQGIQALPGLELSPAQDGAPAAVPAEQSKELKSRKSSPLLRSVSYSPGIPAESRALFQETLSRRKAGWSTQLKTMGLDLQGKIAPILTVTASRDIAKGEKVEFTVGWNQGETRVGAFKAVVTRKNLNPDLRRLPAPMPPKERILRLRFNKTILADMGGIKVEAQVTDHDISKFLEDNGLRGLQKSWEGWHEVAVTGSMQADAVARDLSGRGIVLYATPVALSLPKANRLRIVFKKTTVRDFGGLRVETAVREDEIGAFLRQKGLRVLEVDRDGVWTVGAEGLDTSVAAARLRWDAEVLYATPETFEPFWSHIVVLKLRKSVIVNAGGLRMEAAVSEDDVADVLRRYGLLVVADLGGGAYKAARVVDDGAAKDLAALVAGEAVVESAVAVGSLSEDVVRSAATGAASYKGRPWSSTEYNAAYAMAYADLERRGATPSQLQLFEKLCDEAPVRGGGFNPWSGD